MGTPDGTLTTSSLPATVPGVVEASSIGGTGRRVASGIITAWGAASWICNDGFHATITYGGVGEYTIVVTAPFTGTLRVMAVAMGSPVLVYHSAGVPPASITLSAVDLAGDPADADLFVIVFAT